MSRRVLVVIPAKSRSRRLPGKNMRPLAGKPLLQWTLEAARDARLVDDICVSTDSPEIRDFCQARGVLAPWLRPAHQSGDEVHASVPVLDMLHRMGGESAYTHCVMLLPTSPLRDARWVDEAIQLSLAHGANVVSVTPLGKGLQHLRHVSASGRLLPLLRGPSANVQTQDVPPLHVLNGSVYCSPVRPLLWSRTFHHGEPIALVMPPDASVDVDTEDDLRACELLLALRREEAAVA
jgi:CMP-N-acetylneuraminic acid synthetase